MFMPGHGFGHNLPQMENRERSLMIKRPRHLIVAILACLLSVAAVPDLAAQTVAPTREITKLSGEVYRFRNAGHFSVFAVTQAGIIVTDPISKDAAEW
jgi:hypothetical protein